MKNTPPDDHLPDPHEDQHVAHLSPWVATQFLDLLTRYGEAMYTAGVQDARQGRPDYASIHRVHARASAEIKHLMGVNHE